MASKRLTRSKIVDRLAATTGLSPDQVKSVLRAFAELAYSEAKNGIAIPGIGSLFVVERPAREMVMRFGANAGKVVILPAARSLKFAVSPLAKDMVMGPPKPMPDIFKESDLSVFTFSTEAPEVPDPEIFVRDLEPFAPAKKVESMTTTLRRLPDLRLTTGRIVAADGLMCEGSPPLSRTVPPGAYPLGLVLAKMGDDERIALAILKFSDHAVATWEPAARGDSDDPSANSSKSTTYGVDTAQGSFGDEAISGLISEVEEEAFSDRLSAEIEQSSKHARHWVHIDSAKGSRAIFSSGFGDGTYTSYFGLDKEGQPVSLVTDFKVVKWGPTAER